MSGAAKFLLATVGGGILVGTIGGELANPVMQQRGGDEPWREMLKPEVGASTAASAPPQDLRPYGGRYSYAPTFAEEPIQSGQAYYAEPDWLEYEHEWPEPPTMAELEAQWNSETPDTGAYGRTVEFPAADSSAARAELAVQEAQAAADTPKNEDLPPEPRVARGELPAIW